MKKLIMIVEDEHQIRKDMELILNMNDFECITAENGFEGLKLLESLTPDLIISDIMMPKMDGFEMLKNIQENPTLASIPFLFLTAKIDRQDMRLGMNLGADDFLTKPFNFDDLIEAIETRLKKREATKKIIDDTFEDLKVTIKYSLPHEIRNPINVILGFSDLLKNNLQKTSEDEALDMLEHIHSAGLRLNNMFENYLMISNIEMLNKNPEDLNQKLLDKTESTEITVTDVARHIATKSDRLKDLKLNLKDCSVYMDEDFFKKIISELTENAFKFSDDGSSVEISSKTDGRFFILTVKDCGRGMKPEQVTRIGEYIQFERKLYEQQGLGLGLSLIKKIAEMHKGSIKIDTKLETYTHVTVKIPKVN